MALYYKTRTGHVTAAVDAAGSPVNVEPGAATTSNINTPGDVSMLQGVWVSLASSTIAATSGAVLHLGVSGDAVVSGAPHVIPIGAVSQDTTTTGGAKIVPPFWVPLGIPLKPNQPLILTVTMSGVDPGTPEVAIGVVLT